MAKKKKVEVHKPCRLCGKNPVEWLAITVMPIGCIDICDDCFQEARRKIVPPRAKSPNRHNRRRVTQTEKDAKRQIKMFE